MVREIALIYIFVFYILLWFIIKYNFIFTLHLYYNIWSLFISWRLSNQQPRNPSNIRSKPITHKHNTLSFIYPFISYIPLPLFLLINFFFPSFGFFFFFSFSFYLLIVLRVITTLTTVL